MATEISTALPSMVESTDMGLWLNFLTVPMASGLKLYSTVSILTDRMAFGRTRVLSWILLGTFTVPPISAVYTVHTAWVPFSKSCPETGAVPRKCFTVLTPMAPTASTRTAISSLTLRAIYTERLTSAVQGRWVQYSNFHQNLMGRGKRKSSSVLIIPTAGNLTAEWSLILQGTSTGLPSMEAPSHTGPCLNSNDSSTAPGRRQYCTASIPLRMRSTRWTAW